MNNYIEMYSKKDKEIVRVYNISVAGNGTSFATVFSPNKFNNPQNNFVGWQTVKLSTLVPLEFKDTYINGIPTSKTQKNKAKARLTLVDAIWRTTDNEEFPHIMLENAIEHELKLMNKEEEKEENV